MANKAKMYGQALQEVLQKTPAAKRKQVAENFKRLLKKRGDLRLLSRALQEFKHAWAAREGKIATVVFAKPPSSAMRQALQQKLKRWGFVYKEEIDPMLVGGAKIFLGNELLIDNTIERKLKRVWQKNTFLTL